MNKTLLALSLAFCSMAASAHVFTFDDLSASATGTWIPNGYAGLNWSNFAVVNAPAYTILVGPNGYQNGLVSGTNVAFNSGGTEAITSGGVFTFNSAYFTAAWNDGLTISLTGYNGGSLVDSTSFVVNTSGPTLETLNWSNVDQVVFDSSGGT